MENSIITAMGAVYGALLGSFTTLLVWRLHHEEEGIVKGRSRCPQCQKKLSPAELIPIISWLWQRGKCKNCAKPIPVFYPLVELAFAVTGGLFVQQFWGQSDFWPLIISVFFLLVLWVYDMRFMEVDRRISWPAILLAAGWVFFQPDPTIFWMGGLGGWLFYALQHYGSGGRWVGAGDMELGLLMGLLLGWKFLLLALFLAYILGALWSLPLLLLRKVNGKTALPMGAFLMPAALVFLYAGEEVWDWYWYGILGFQSFQY
jgi:prepilin signal peptidase PulO-like enzyme (type II secretory pathway)